MTHHWKHHGPGRWIKYGILFVIFAILAIFVFGYASMSLWNALMPAIFGLKTIGFEQAVGLLLLSWIFFGRFRGHHWRGGHWRHRMAERWMRMSPEDREKFREEMHHRWGGWHHHDDEPPAGSGNVA